MAAWFRRDKEPRQRTVLASGRRVRIEDQTEIKILAKRQQEWQPRAWAYYDLVGELKYGVNYIGDRCSKVKLFAAERPADDPDADPVPTANRAVIDAVQRLNEGGGHAQIMRIGPMNMTVAGEGYLIGLDDSPTTGESWEFHSIDDVSIAGERVRLKELEDGSVGRDLTGNDYLGRIWSPHPRRAALPDSPVNGVLSSLEKIVTAERAIRSILKSRIALHGIFVFPEEATVESPDPTVEVAEDEADPVTRMIWEHISAALSDEGSAAAAAPLLMKLPGELTEKVKFLQAERLIDGELITQLDHAIRRVAAGLNLPPERLLGKGDLNHWTSWQVDDDEFRGHLEPIITQFLGGLTRAYLKPTLAEMGVDDVSRYTIWFDPSDLIVRPNREQSANDGHDRLVISDEAWRTAHGYDDDDAPSEDEIERRIRIKAAGRALPQSESEEPSTTETQSPPAEEEDEETQPEEQAVTAAVKTINGEALGRQLADIDRVLRRDVLVAADAAMHRALERVGARVASKARKDQAVAATIASVPYPEVAARLGPALVAALGLEDNDLLEGAFVSLKPKFDSWVKRAQRAALKLIPGLTGSEFDSLGLRQDGDRDDAWGWFEAKLIETAKQRMYSPAVDEPVLGEVDVETAVPFGHVREAIARAGGAEGIENKAGVAVANAGRAPVGGVATGRLVTATLHQKGGRIEEFEWVYGVYPRTRPFEPHMALDGLRFANFDDAVLRNTDSFPETDFYLPGDHAGCVCDWNTIWSFPPSAAEAEEPALAASG